MLIYVLAVAMPSLTAAEPLGVLQAGRQRQLDNTQRLLLFQAVQSFGSQKFWILLETGGPAPHSEPENFARQLSETLASAGWIKTNTLWQRMGAAGFRQVAMQDYSKEADRGVVIFAPRKSQRAAAALNATFRKISLESSVEIDENLRGAILVCVGSY